MSKVAEAFSEMHVQAEASAFHCRRGAEHFQEVILKLVPGRLYASREFK